jgi:hypothetical protein
LQRLPFAYQGVQKYLPLLPLAIEQLDLREYEIILSSSFGEFFPLTNQVEPVKMAIN